MVGILMVIFFSIIILYDLKSPAKVGSFLGFILSGLVYYLIRRKYLQSKGVHPKSLRIKEATWDG
jgi:hypothetical protein